MAEIQRIRVAWGSFAGGPGVTTFYNSGTDIGPSLTAINTFCETLKQIVPSGLTLTVPGTGDIIDDASGSLTGQWQHGGDTVHTGSGTGNYSGVSGMLVRFHTATIHNGRRLQGRIFVVPMITSVLTNSGIIAAGTCAQVATAANTMISASSGGLVVWGRPKNGAGGMHGTMTDAAVPAQQTVLRSRRQ